MLPPHRVGFLFNSVDVRLVGVSDPAVMLSVRTTGIGGFEFTAVPIGQYNVEIDVRPDPAFRIDFSQPSQAITVIENQVAAVMFVGTLAPR